MATSIAPKALWKAPRLANLAKPSPSALLSSSVPGEPDDMATVVQEGFQDLPARTEHSCLWNGENPADNPVGGATCQSEEETEDLHCLTPAMVSLFMQQSEEGVEGFLAKAEIRSGVINSPSKKIWSTGAVGFIWQQVLGFAS